MNSGNYKLFNSIDNKHQIETNVIENTSWFNINFMDFESFKTFLILLKDILIYMKNNNVGYIKQYVREEDIVYFKKSSIINLDEDIYMATTKIEDFTDEIVSLFDIKKI